MAQSLSTEASQAVLPDHYLQSILETTFTEWMGNRIDLKSDTVVFKRSLPLVNDRRDPQAQKTRLFNHLLLLLNVKPDSALVRQLAYQQALGTHIYITGLDDPSNRCRHTSRLRFTYNVTGAL